MPGKSSEVRLPRDAVQALLNVKNDVESGAYDAACQILIKLDAVDLLNDQVMIDVEEETHGLCLQWPFYGIFCDVDPGSQFTVFDAATGTQSSFTSGIFLEAFDHLRALLITKVVPDEFDAYLKTKRTTANTLPISALF